jgi:hypothetical protein
MVRPAPAGHVAGGSTTARTISSAARPGLPLSRLVCMDGMRASPVSQACRPRLLSCSIRHILRWFQARRSRPRRSFLSLPFLSRARTGRPPSAAWHSVPARDHGVAPPFGVACAGAVTSQKRKDGDGHARSGGRRAYTSAVETKPVRA